MGRRWKPQHRQAVGFLAGLMAVAVLAAACSAGENVATSSAPVEAAQPVSPLREEETPDWLLNGEPIPPSETVPPPQPGDLVDDEITAVDEAIAADLARHEAAGEPTLEGRNQEYAAQLAGELGISPAAALHGLNLLTRTEVSGFDRSITEWLGESHAGGWIDWEPDTAFFHYVYEGVLPDSAPPALVAELLDSGDLVLVPAAGP